VSNENGPTGVTSFLVPTATATSTTAMTQTTAPVQNLPVNSQGLSSGALTGIIIASSSVLLAILVVFVIRKWQLRVSIVFYYAVFAV